MISVEDKIQAFEKLLKKTIEKKNITQLEDILKEADEEISKYKEKMDRLSKETQADMLRKHEIKKDSIISNTVYKGQNIISKEENHILDDINESLEKEIKAVYEKEFGEKFLKNYLNDLKNENMEKMVFLVGKDFENRDKKIIKEFFPNNEIRTTPIIDLGGFIVDSLDASVRINCSVDFLLSTKQEQINKKIKEFLSIEE